MVCTADPGIGYPAGPEWYRRICRKKPAQGQQMAEGQLILTGFVAAVLFPADADRIGDCGLGQLPVETDAFQVFGIVHAHHLHSPFEKSR